MTSSAVIVVVLAGLAVVAFLVWMVVSRHPESAATHDRDQAERARRETDDLAAGVERPADPNAEAQGPAIGDARPGPIDHPR